MSKRSTLGKKVAEARPSRIRREPPPLEKPASLEKALWQSREWEIGLAFAGITMFALAICALVFDLGEFLFR